MSELLKYYIAQYIRDPLRQEPINIGIIATRGAEAAARFTGEGDGGLDGRKLRQFNSPVAYREWVSYWRRQVNEGAYALAARLEKSQSVNFRTVEGGELTGVGADSLQQGVSYLFNVLVADGGLLAARLEAGEADGDVVAADQPTDVRLRESVNSAFVDANIFATADGQAPALVPHPVRSGVKLSGTLSEPHTPPFVQQNGLLWVMETVDFTSANKERAKEKAGLSAAVFDDLKKAHKYDMQTICIVKHRPEDLAVPAVRYGRDLVGSESNVMVNWLDDHERAAFLAERREIAFSLS